MQLSIRRYSSLAIALGLIACPNQVGKPIAKATAPGSVNIGAVVQLDGCGSTGTCTLSTDPQGRQLTFSWTLIQQPPGSTATLNNAQSQTPSFKADVAGAYIVQLVVSNGLLFSDPVEVTITVNACGANQPVIGTPTATPQGGAAGAAANPKQKVTLSAQVTDLDTSCGFPETVTYIYQVTAKPTGSAASLDTPTGSLVPPNSATATIVPDLPGQYQVQLVVTDSTGLKSPPSFVSFTATNCGFAPVAGTISSSPGTGVTGTAVTLSATPFDTSCPTSMQTFLYSWALTVTPPGSHATLDNPSSPTPKVTPDLPGNYQVSLVVTDAQGISSPIAYQNINITPAAATSFKVSVATSSVTAGASDSFTVTALDASGNVATGYTGTVNFTSSDGQATFSPGANHPFVAADKGVFTGSVTLKTATGVKTIVATDSNGITGSTSVTVNPSAAASLVVSVAQSSLTAGGSSDVTVTARDQFGNTATGYSGTVHFVSTDASATLPSDSTLNSGTGTKTFSGGVTFRTSGSQSVMASDTATPSLTGSSNLVTVSPNSATNFIVTAGSTSSIAGSPVNFTVTARDQFNNTATGYGGTMHLTSTDPAALLPANSTLTSGTKTFSATFKTTNPQSITATDTLAPSVTGTSAFVIVNPAPTDNFLVTVTSGTVTAGGSSSFTVTARDQLGNTVPGYNGVVGFTSSDFASVLPANYKFLASDAGAHLFSSPGVTFKTAGSQTVTATDVVTASITGISSGVTVSAAALNSFLVTVASNPITAGNASDFTVTARDQFGNKLTTFTGPVTFSSSDGQAVPLLPASYNFTTGASADNGAHTFSGGVTFKTAGSQTITAISGGVSSASASVTVNSAAAASISLTGLPGSVTAGVATSVTVTAFDGFGNVAKGYTGTVQFGSGNSSDTLPSNLTFAAGDNGAKSSLVVLRTAGARTVTVTDGTFISSQSTNVTASGLNNFLVTVAKNPVTAGHASDFTVTSRDAFNNKITNFTGIVSFTSSDSAVGPLPSSYTFTTGASADNGTHAFVAGVTFNTAGSQTITATSGAVNTASAAVAVLAVPNAPITAPTNATSGKTYVASVLARAGSKYTWAVDGSTALIVSAGGASGVLSSDGSTNSITFASGAVGTRTITCFETNAANDSNSLSPNSAPVNVLPAAVAPVVDLSQRAHTTGGVDGNGGVTAGTSYSAFATIHAANPANTYSWTIVGGVFPNGSNGCTNTSGCASVNSTPGTQGTTTVLYVPNDVPYAQGTASVLISCTETNAAGDSSATGTASVRAYPKPLPPVVTVASNMTTGLTYPGTLTSHPGMNYTWAVDDNGNVAPATAVSVTVTAGDANATSPKTMTITTKEFNAIGDFATTTTTVNVHPVPNAAFTTPPNVTNNVASTASITTTHTGSTYAWMLTGGSVTPASATGSSVTFTAQNAGTTVTTVSISVTETNGAGTPDTKSTTVNVYPTPNASFTAPNVTNNLTGTASITTTHSGSTYTWTLSGSGVSPTSATGTSVIFTAQNPGTTVTTVGISVTETNGATVPATDTKSTTVNVYPTPNASFTAPNVTNNVAGTASITTTHSGSTYAWTLSGSGVSPTSATGTNVTFTAQNSGTTVTTVSISVTETNGANPAATDTKSTTVNVYPTPNATFTVPANVTSGVSNAASISTVHPSSTYDWTLAGSSVTPTSATHTTAGTVTSVSFTATNATTATSNTPTTVNISATETNGASATNTASQTVNVWPVPAVSIFTSSSVGVVSGGTVTLSATYTGANVDGTVTNDAGLTSFTLATGATSSAITLTQTTTFTLTISNGAGVQATRTSRVQVVAPVVTQGKSHACAIRNSTGDLFCWGNNDFGQLGDGTTTSRAAAGTAIADPSGDAGAHWLWVAAGVNFTCATRTSGKLYCWGDPNSGELGNNVTTGTFNTPQRVCTGATCPGTDTNFVFVRANGNHACASKQDGSLFCWGANSAGQNGSGGTGATTVPTAVVASIASVTFFGVGLQHMCGVTTAGNLSCTGDNTHGQLGIGATAVTAGTPQPVGSGYSKVAGGNDHTCAVKTDGTLWCWGSNAGGQVTGVGGADVMSPAQLPAPDNTTDWARVAIGDSFSCGAKTDNTTVKCWGWNTYGQVGQPSSISDAIAAPVATVPTTVSGTASGQHLFAHFHQACAGSIAGGVSNNMKCWGRNDQGQLGAGTAGTKLTPTAVSGQTTVINVSAGAQNSCVVSSATTLGPLSCSGRAALSGNSPSFSSASYSQVGALSTWTQSSVGYSGGTDVEALGLQSATTGFFGWGLNSFGQLAGGNTTAHVTPTAADASPAQSWSSVSTGDTSCGIGGTGSSLWCWGSNAFGAVGVNVAPTTTASFSTPQAVDTTNAWVAVSVGHGGSVCGIRGTSGSGGLFCWGNPANGRLGNGTTTTNVLVPTQISDGGTAHTDWTAISVGTGHPCGIRSGASGVFCWGLNANGQVGDGTTTDKTSPTAVAIGASLNAARVSAGDVHTCAVTTGGALYCWGDNSNGLLGTGTKTGNSGTNQTAPLQIGVATTWTRVAVGKTDTYALQGSALWDWGFNDQGQLGDATAFNGAPQNITVP